MPARECAFGERCISPPGNVGRAARSLQADAADEAVVQHQTAQRGHPEAEGIHPGERHIPGADHQGNQIVGKSNDQRHPHKEDHGGSMHGENAVEDLGGEKIVMRHGQLNAQQDRLEAPDQQKDHGVGDVHQANLFVVDGDHPTVHLFEPCPVRLTGGVRSMALPIGRVESAIPKTLLSILARVRLTSRSLGKRRLCRSGHRSIASPASSFLLHVVRIFDREAPKLLGIVGCSGKPAYRGS